MIFISGVRKEKGEVTAPAHMFDDDRVRDFDNLAELARHVKGDTDHLGSISVPGTLGRVWARFSPQGLNIFGEQHDHVRLLDVVGKVGTRSFIDESFFVEKLATNSKVFATCVLETAGARQRLDIDAARMHDFGADALFPKMAVPLPMTLAYLKGRQVEMRRGSALGFAAQYALRIAWAYVRDLDANVETVPPGGAATAPKPKLSDAENRAAGNVMAYDASIDPFVATLNFGGYLGDKVDARSNPLLLGGLTSVLEDVIEVMYERIGDDPVLDATERTLLLGRSRTGPEAQGETFALWRNMRFARTIAPAAVRGVRYAGVGAGHLLYLIDNGKVPRGSYLYDMRPAGSREVPKLTGKPGVTPLTRMVEHTAELRESA
ncbi:hypothetical protein [Phytomonospora endophytica]|uniref:Uncharacterized protein n=1 Tax=Phytomonospora endophytica TaxID=714109 RepID=A0A841FJY2_9ACTN|nr:hypothetical protein [Phytomonospora endophytica]MBB6036155.1 hypothetical protein [Phytomonospora endophytica]GIG67058.1 hypothetical protein Pen01_33530 [Phytomonospora endophytica]